jgi:sterol desaturase/sphingolipid hydroxylase (fatty acid hydroxylase superfamily)
MDPKGQLAAPRPRPSLDLWFERLFSDQAPTDLGSGWASGTASVFLGAVALLAVVVLWFPGWLSTARFRPLYPLPVLRALIEGVIATAFAAGVLSLLLRRRKVLGLTGCALSLVAALLGGGGVARGPGAGGTGAASPLTFGLDWFLLNLFLLALVFVPMERLFPQWPEQGTFRPGWTTDTLHFLVSHAFVQGLSYLILLPATTLAGVWQPEGLQAWVRGQPVWLQLLEVLLVADMTQYAVHRCFHVVPVLWRFHAVHHSSEVLDWIAGSRLHLVDAVMTRGLVLVPLVLLGFAPAALHGYLVFVSFHAVFIHANLRFSFGALERVLVTPRFHHWHHAVEEAARDRNFAVHLPILDRVFGTEHLPPRAWPEGYGITGAPVPAGWGGQLVYPFHRPDRVS